MEHKYIYLIIDRKNIVKEESKQDEGTESNSLIVKIPKQKSKEKREILKRQDQVRRKII